MSEIKRVRIKEKPHSFSYWIRDHESQEFEIDAFKDIIKVYEEMQ